MKAVEDVINLNFSEATGEIPVEVQFRKCYRLDMERNIEYPPKNERNWDEVRQQIHDRLWRKAKKRNKRHRVVMEEFKVGQKVMIRKDRISNKFKKKSAKLSQLFTGPVIIRKRLGLSTYLVEMKGPNKLYRIHNIKNMYPYINRCDIKEANFEMVGHIKTCRVKDSASEVNCDKYRRDIPVKEGIERDELRRFCIDHRKKFMVRGVVDMKCKGIGES